MTVSSQTAVFMELDLGDMKRIAVEFMANSAYADPTTVQFEIRHWADEAPTVYTFNVPDPETSFIRRDEIGQYRVDVEFDQPGRWFYRWVGDGAVVDAATGYAWVNPALTSGALDLSEIDLTVWQLRARLGEAPGDYSIFGEDDLMEILAYADDDIDTATFEGWKRKAARLSRLIDVSESGSDRQLSQRYKQAKSMLDYWGKTLSDAGNAHADAIAGRVVGRVINWAKVEDPNPGTPFSGYSEHIHAYPTHRFLMPSIMG